MKWAGNQTEELLVGWDNGTFEQFHPSLVGGGTMAFVLQLLERSQLNFVTEGIKLTGVGVILQPIMLARGIEFGMRLELNVPGTGIQDMRHFMNQRVAQGTTELPFGRHFSPEFVRVIESNGCRAVIVLNAVGGGMPALALFRGNHNGCLVNHQGMRVGKTDFPHRLGFDQFFQTNGFKKQFCCSINLDKNILRQNTPH